MKLRHKTPCHECPWRKDSPAGWLGGHSAEYYADAVQENEIPACHLYDYGPDDNSTCFCAGALAVGLNSCILPFDKDAVEARGAVDRSNEVFQSVRDFYKYHASKEYVLRIMRQK